MSTKHSIALTALAAALALPLSSANAAVVGSFDPSFGPSIPNLGFRGQITMQLSDGCNGLTGYQSINPVGYGSGCIIQATSAYIDFYNSKDDPMPDPLDPATKTPLNRQNLTYADFGASYIYGAYFDANGMLDGIDTQYSNPFSIAVSDFSDPAFPVHYNDGYGGSVNNTMVLYFISGDQPGDPAFLDNIGPQGTRTQSGPGVVTFQTVPDTTVPEPDSIALTGLGLAALFATLRRRKKGARRSISARLPLTFVAKVA